MTLFIEKMDIDTFKTKRIDSFMFKSKYFLIGEIFKEMFELTIDNFFTNERNKEKILNFFEWFNFQAKNLLNRQNNSI